jgi:hypothetical protein
MSGPILFVACRNMKKFEGEVPAEVFAQTCNAYVSSGHNHIGIE